MENEQDDGRAGGDSKKARNARDMPSEVDKEIWTTAGAAAIVCFNGDVA